MNLKRRLAIHFHHLYSKSPVFSMYSVIVIVNISLYVNLKTLLICNSPLSVLRSHMTTLVLKMTKFIMMKVSVSFSWYPNIFSLSEILKCVSTFPLNHNSTSLQSGTVYGHSVFACFVVSFLFLQ